MRIIIQIMLLIIAGTSFYAGLCMLQDPTGQSAGLDIIFLKSTPFGDYFFPGLLMIILISIPSLFSFILILAKKSGGYRQAMISGTLLTCWVVIQLIFIPGYTEFSILYLLLGMMTVLISLQLRGKQAL